MTLMKGRFMLRRAGQVLLFLAACSAFAQTGTGLSATAGQAITAPAIEYTFIQSLPGKREQLKRFIALNWFVMDAKAVDQGLMERYQLLESTDETAQWDVVVAVTYKTPQGYSAIAPAFERIRAAHAKQLVEGLDFKELGKIVASRKLHAVTHP
jgi:hypothetical protein